MLPKFADPDLPNATVVAQYCPGQNVRLRRVAEYFDERLHNGRERGCAVTGEIGSSVPRRQLGRKLRELREAVPMTMAEAWTALEWSRQRLWRYETGQVAVHPNDVAAMCAVYGADKETIEGLKELARQSKAKAWWQAYLDIPAWFELYLGMESAAATLRQYEAEVIPGLLQSPRYVEAIMALGPEKLSAEAINERVTLRMQRQRILTRSKPAAPMLSVILSEAALVRGFSAEIMVDQLHRLIAVSELPNVSIHIVPFSAGMHTAYLGPFVILDFPQESPARDPEPTTVYQESPTGSLYLENSTDVETYSSIWTELGKLAMNELESRRFIEQKVKEW